MSSAPNAAPVELIPLKPAPVILCEDGTLRPQTFAETLAEAEMVEASARDFSARQTWSSVFTGSEIEEAIDDWLAKDVRANWCSCVVDDFQRDNADAYRSSWSADIIEPGYDCEDRSIGYIRVKITARLPAHLREAA